MSTEATQIITAAEVAQVATERRSLLATFAGKYGLEPNNMMRTLRATVLRPSSNGVEASNEQVAAFLIVANHHGLNPFTKEVHGFVDKRGGIVPIVGVDGWAKKINEHEAFNGMSFEQTDDACTCTMHRKDRAHPVVVTEYLSECKTSGQAWTTHPKRMLRHRAMVQAARLAFSFAGIVDPDEGEQVLSAVNAEIDVTPRDDQEQETEFGPAKIGAVRMRKIVESLLAAVEKQDHQLLTLYNDLTNAEKELVWRQLRTYERSAIKKLLDAAKAAQPAKELGPWAVETLKASATPEALETTWRLVQDAYAEIDQEAPLDLNTLYTDLKAGMSP